MALHVRGVVLPDGEVRDLWLVGDRVTLDPVAGAETISDGGWIVPGLVDAHCHLGIANGREAGSPFPYPELDDEPGIPRLVRAGRHIAPIRRYLRDIGVEVAAEDVVA